MLNVGLHLFRCVVFKLVVYRLEFTAINGEHPITKHDHLTTQR